MSDDVTVTQLDGPPPDDGVTTFGWRFEWLRRRKVRCVKCDRWCRHGVVNHDADADDPDLRMVCKRCYDEMP